MHVVTYDRFGPAAEVLHLGQMDLPTLGADEVRVALHRSGVNPSDVKSRAGTRPGVTKPAFDRIIPHSDGAGVIEAVGSNIDPARIGARVWIWNGQWQRPFGTAASHITLPSDQAVDLPDAVDFDAAASLGIPGLTAAQAVFGAGDVTGQTILVQGGSGTVSYLAVQLAKWGGARVIATAAPRDFDRVREAGADVVLDYGAEDLSDQILAATSGAFVDQIMEVEFGVNIATNAEVIAPNGRIAAYGSAKEMSPTLPFGPLLFKAATIDILLIYLLPKPKRDQMIAKLHQAFAEGALTCPVDRVFALSETVKAHEAVEAGGRHGAILIDCQSEG